MSLTVINQDTSEEAAETLRDDMLDLAKDLADQLAKTGERWTVVRTTTHEEVIYQGKQNDPAYK